MKERFTKKLTVFLFSFLFFNTAFAVTFISISDGNWNSPNTWNQSLNPINQVPGLNDDVVIDGYKVTVDSDVGTVVKIFVKSNQTSGDSKLIMIQGGRLATTGELVVEAPNRAIDTEVLLSGDAILDIGTSVSFTRTEDNNQTNILRLQMIENSSMLVGTTFDFSYKSSADGEQTEEISLLNNAHLTIEGNTTFTLNAGKIFQMNIDGSAIVDINGLLSASNYTGKSLNIEVTNGGTLNVDDEINLHNYDSSIGVILVAKGGGLIAADSSITMNSYMTDKLITLITDGSTGSVISVANNISLQAQSEGDVLINLVEGKLEIGGNFERPTGFGDITMGETASLVYNGTTPQVIACNTMPSGGSDAFDLKNVVFDNSAGMITEGPLVIDKEMSLGTGIIETTAANPIIIADGGTISGGNTNAFISGPIHKEGSMNGSSFIFPTGKGTTYAPIEITPVTTLGLSSVIVAEYKGDPPPYIDNVETGNTGISNEIEGLSHISTMEHWTLSRTGGTEDIKVELHWTDASARGIDDLNALVVAQLNPADDTWYNSGTGVIEGGLTTPGSVETGDPPPYIEAFTFASTLPSSNSLPVEMTRFEAQKGNDNNVQLFWETASELNSDYFMVERSENGLDFYTLDRVKSKGTTNNVSSYKTTDKNPFYGMNYYRLRQVDLDGKESFSEALAIKVDIKSAMLLFPNPVLDDINIRLENEFEKEVVIEIFDQSGRLIFAEEFENVSKYMKLQTVQVNITNRGTYFMKIHTSAETIIQKFMAGY